MSSTNKEVTLERGKGEIKFVDKQWVVLVCLLCVIIAIDKYRLFV